MTNITLSVPEELKKKMDAFKVMNWSEVARQAIKERIEDLEIMNKITSRSKLTKKNVKEFSEKINKLAHQRFMNEHNIR